jgi:hypothetical protein
MRNAKAKSIDPRIFHQQVPNLLLALIDNPSNDSGPTVNILLEEIRAAKLSISVKVYSMVRGSLMFWSKCCSSAYPNFRFPHYAFYDFAFDHP